MLVSWVKSKTCSFSTFVYQNFVWASFSVPKGGPGYIYIYIYLNWCWRRVIYILKFCPKYLGHLFHSIHFNPVIIPMYSIWIAYFPAWLWAVEPLDTDACPSCALLILAVGSPSTFVISGYAWSYFASLVFCDFQFHRQSCNAAVGRVNGFGRLFNMSSRFVLACVGVWLGEFERTLSTLFWHDQEAFLP